MNEVIWLAVNGFTKDGFIYIVSGGNTYEIKDMLKQSGCRFNKLLGWYTKEKIEVPAPYKLTRFHYKELFAWEGTTARPYEDIKDRIKRKVGEDKPVSILSHEFYDEVGNRFYELPVVVKRIQTKLGNENFYIYHFIYNEKYYFIWSTKKKLNIGLKQTILLTGTIVSHCLYYGHKINKINRCIIK